VAKGFICAVRWFGFVGSGGVVLSTKDSRVYIAVAIFIILFRFYLILLILLFIFLLFVIFISCSSGFSVVLGFLLLEFVFSHFLAFVL
jgi:hypothetical protein